MMSAWLSTLHPKCGQMFANNSKKDVYSISRWNFELEAFRLCRSWWSYKLKKHVAKAVREKQKETRQGKRWKEPIAAAMLQNYRAGAGV